MNGNTTPFIYFTVILKLHWCSEENQSKQLQQNDSCRLSSLWEKRTRFLSLEYCIEILQKSLNSENIFRSKTGY